jgi:PPK2 family polyphosphate:nucleotide phosphotransferase
MRDALQVPPGTVDLAGYDPDARPLAPTDRNVALLSDLNRLRTLQERLWAESTVGGRRRVLLVLQGTDTSGKGGVARHVVGAFGATGVQYSAFAAPTAEELAHDFLWRIRKRLPEPGMLGVFDRSHYEDVLIARVHNLVPQEAWEARYDLINEFEAGLAEDGVTVVKCFLNISYDTQRERLLDRLDNPDKHWKFAESDLTERARWSEYQAAFSAMLERCNTLHAPWYVVPGNRKKYRNWAVAEVLRETLEELDPQYPHPDLDVPALKARLAPPR